MPSKFSDPEKGGDGDALEVLVISQTVKTGSILEIISIAILKLSDDGKLVYKIIAVPIANDDKILQATNYLELTTKYPGVKEILEIWFSNYDAEERTEILGWEDQKSALFEIKKQQRH
ncbi:MAG TPA: inorganic diphosphatase [Salegentibacter sp.]|uniref:inorganic diphosphatase n=1 Tax=Salegentibacter sp. TaxID=1903072 RepID=UPI002F9293B8